MKKTAILAWTLLVIILVAGCRSDEEITHLQQQKAQEIIVRQENPVVEHRILRVTGNGQVKAAPDLATLRFGISAEASLAEDAQTLLSERMQLIEEALAGLGVFKGDRSQQDITLYPIQDQEKATPVTTGYNASTILTVSVRKVEQAGNIIGAMIELEGVEVQSVEFALVNETAAYREALDAAMTDAVEKAEVMAATAGVKITAPALVEEISVAGEAADATVLTITGEELLGMPVTASQISISAQVLVEYWLG